MVQLLMSALPKWDAAARMRGGRAMVVVGVGGLMPCRVQPRCWAHPCTGLSSSWSSLGADPL